MNNTCCKQNSCGCDPCGQPLRVLSIKELSDRPGALCFNLDGHSVVYDFTDLIAAVETDTHLRVDSVARQLVYLAEDHVNHITAKQLGGMLHLGDIGDVNMGEVEQNSLLVYQKNSDCAKGCDEVSNQWVAFNSSEHLTDNLKTVFGFDDNDAPVSLQPPEHTNQFYSLTWRGQDKLGYTQPVEVAVPSVDGDGFSQLLFANPTTKQIEMLKVKVDIDNQGNVTFKTQGSV